MDGREQRGLQIAATMRLSRKGDTWIVPSQTRNGSYTVKLAGAASTCSCPDHETHHGKCKHIFAVEFTVQRDVAPDGTTTITKTTRVTYSQNWPQYNAAQTSEKTVAASLLKELCSGIPQPSQGRGRPRLPLSDWPSPPL